MIDAVAFSVAVASVAVALVVGVRLATRRYRWRAVVPGFVAIEAMLLVLAALDIAGLIGGHHPAEPATHLAYLGAALVVLPVAASQAAGDDGVWAGLLVVGAAVVLAVLIVRLQTTWRPARG
jgi:peptidoglycan/LPS O-acetylase OafA/YrhL